MPWPLSTLQALVAKGVLRDDLAALSNNYADYINQALKEFQDKRSWLSQRMDTGPNDLVIPAGSLVVAMPANFKELQSKNTDAPVTLVLNDPNFPGARRLIEVIFETEQLRRLWAFGGVVGAFFAQGFSAFSVAMVRDGRGTSLQLAIPNTDPLTFHVKYIGYLPQLVLSGDTNPISDAYPQMVIAKAKSLALADVNDPAADALETFSQKKFMEAAIAEGREDLVGRSLHM